MLQEEGGTLTEDATGHGTVVAATACGSPVNGGTRFLSPAYQSEIVMVKVKPCKQYLREYYLLPQEANAYQSSDIMMAIKYIDGLATILQKPVVICIGMGTNYRDHEGNDILSRYIDSICEKRNRAVVITGGNEGNARHHFRGFLSESHMETAVSVPGSVQADSEKIEIDVAANTRGFLLQIWASVPADLSFLLQTPSGESLRPTPVFFQPTLKYRFLYENTVITVYNSRIDRSSGVELILIRFENPSAGIWTLSIKNEGDFTNVVYDAWLPITEFIGGGAAFLTPSVETTMTTPSYAGEAITTSTYDSYNSSFYLNSGRGFSRQNKIKPDLATPGVDITTVGNRLGSVPRIDTYTGGSLAAAILTGACAQFMQWAVIDGNVPYIRSNEIKNYLISGARRTSQYSYPNKQWGAYGIIMSS